MNNINKIHSVICILFVIFLANNSCVNKANYKSDTELMVESIIQPYIRGNNFQGVILIARNDSIIMNKAYGHANIDKSIFNESDTKFQIGSISKSFTAAAIMLLKEKGELRLDQQISDFIPSFPNGDKISIHHLLGHTSGLGRFIFLPDYNEKSKKTNSTLDLVNWFKSQPMAFETGSRYGYSNSNYAILAHIIEIVSGMKFGEFLKENIFYPLNLENTGHSDYSNPIEKLAVGHNPVLFDDIEVSDYFNYSVLTGSGSLYGTSEDIFKWNQAIMKGDILSDSSVHLLMNHDDKESSYGWIPSEWHSKKVFTKSGWDGVGFSCQYVYFIEDKLSVIILSNLNISGVTKEIALNISAMMLNQGTEEKSFIFEPIMDSELVKKMTGIYRFGEDFYVPNSSLEIIEKDGFLFVNGAEPGKETALLQVGENEFIHRQYWFNLSFIWDEDSIITGVNYDKFTANKEE